MTRSAGGKDDQCGSRPPSGANANPPTHTGPAPGGVSAGSFARRPRARREHAATTSPNRSSPRETISWALPSAARANPSRSGCSQQNQRSPASRDAKIAALGSSTSIGTVTLTSRLLSPASASSASSDSRAAGASIKARLLVRARPEDGDLAGARHLDQPVRADHALEGVDLLRRAGDLDGQRASRDVDDLPLEELGELHDVA